MQELRTTDPVEQIIERALIACNITYEINVLNLDFYLPDQDIYIECKRFHSDRIAEQMSRVPCIIVIHGIRTANIFASILKLAFHKRITE